MHTHARTHTHTHTPCSSPPPQTHIHTFTYPPPKRGRRIRHHTQPSAHIQQPAPLQPLSHATPPQPLPPPSMAFEDACDLAMLPPLGKEDLFGWPGHDFSAAAPFSVLDELLLDVDDCWTVATAADDQLLGVVPDLLELDLASVQAGLQQHCSSSSSPPHSPPAAAAWAPCHGVRPQPLQQQPGCSNSGGVPWGLVWVPAGQAASGALSSISDGDGDTSSSSVSGVPSAASSSGHSRAASAQSGSVLGAALPRAAGRPAPPAASSPQPACAHQHAVGPVSAPATPAAVVAAAPPPAAVAVVSAQPPAAAAVTRAVLNATCAAPAPAAAAAARRPATAARVAAPRAVDAGRAAAVARYRAKRQRRLARVAAGVTKVVKYARRKEVADSRPRVGGRFVKVVRDADAATQ